MSKESAAAHELFLEKYEMLNSIKGGISRSDFLHIAGEFRESTGCHFDVKMYLGEEIAEKVIKLVGEEPVVDFYKFLKRSAPKVSLV